MREARIIKTARVKLNKPILIAGLPGQGLVGKVAVDHLIKETKAKKFAELLSPHFPPIVVVQKDGIARMIKNEFYFLKRKGNDIVFMTGDHQGLTVESFYEHAGKTLDFAKEMGASFLLTLGGLPLRKISKAPKVYGAATDAKLIRKYSDYGVSFSRPGDQIVGAAGLLLGLGKLEGIDGVCLMGETHGTYIDPNSAKAVLKAVEKATGLKLNYKELDARSKKMQKMFEKMKGLQQPPQMEMPKQDLSYIR